MSLANSVFTVGSSDDAQALWIIALLRLFVHLLYELVYGPLHAFLASSPCSSMRCSGVHDHFCNYAGTVSAEAGLQAASHWQYAAIAKFALLGSVDMHAT